MIFWLDLIPWEFYFIDVLPAPKLTFLQLSLWRSFPWDWFLAILFLNHRAGHVFCSYLVVSFRRKWHSKLLSVIWLSYLAPLRCLAAAILVMNTSHVWIQSHKWMLYFHIDVGLFVCLVSFVLSFIFIILFSRIYSHCSFSLYPLSILSIFNFSFHLLCFLILLLIYFLKLVSM